MTKGSAAANWDFNQVERVRGRGWHMSTCGKR